MNSKQDSTSNAPNMIENCKGDHETTRAAKTEASLIFKNFVTENAMVHWNAPKHHSYDSFAARLRSFNSYWEDEIQPTAESLSQAGFFMTVRFIFIKK
jgi:hypothetical protein